MNLCNNYLIAIHVEKKKYILVIYRYNASNKSKRTDLIIITHFAVHILIRYLLSWLCFELYFNLKLLYSEYLAHSFHKHPDPLHQIDGIVHGRNSN